MTILGNWKRRRAERKALAFKNLWQLDEFLHSEEFDELMNVLKRDPLLFGCDMDDYNPEQRDRLEKARVHDNQPDHQ